MHQAMLAAVAMAGWFLPAVTAHMIMASPVPYGKDSLNNSPLGGAMDFPCKQRSGVYAVSQMNNMVAGTDQTLSFSGTAVHGGGSCQLSISPDKEPTAQSKFKVIHSIIGGCPGVDGAPRTFNFQIPKDFPNGQYALAWTWFNKIGNREMYMNCAPITVSGGSEDKSAIDKLPDMFVANIGTNQCKTPETKDIVFPNPGSSVETSPAAALESNLPGCGGSSASPAGSGSGSGSGGAIPGAPAAAPATSPQSGAGSPTATANIKAPTGSASSGAGNAGLQFTATSIATTLVTVTKSAGAGSSASPVPASGNSLSNSGSGTGSSGMTSTCSQEGAIMCNGTSQFGICNHGSVIWQAVAPGTTCSNGQIS